MEAQVTQFPGVKAKTSFLVRCLLLDGTYSEEREDEDGLARLARSLEEVSDMRDFTITNLKTGKKLRFKIVTEEVA